MANASPSVALTSLQISRKCDSCEEKEKILQPKPATDTAEPADEAPPIVHKVLSSPGQSLDAATRALFEHRFGHDFSQVRVHTDGQASESARNVDALAYAAGRHLVFAEGQYSPNTTDGQKLLSHELAHIVQQGAASPVAHAGELESADGLPSLVQRQARGGQAQQAQLPKAAAGISCPGYEPGEASQSKREPGVLASPVAELKSDILLVADFGVSWRHLKPSTRTNTDWQQWLKLATGDPNASFQVTGHSDCAGDEHDNAELRLGRARQVAERVRELAPGHECSFSAASVGIYVTDNLTERGRAINRGATLAVLHAAASSAFHGPESVAEMAEMLDDAENLMEDPAFLNTPSRRRLYGAQPPLHDWKPDTAGALQRIDAVLAFVKPLVDADNIERHGAHALSLSSPLQDVLNRTNLKATGLGLYYTTDWLETAKKGYDEVASARAQAGVDVNALAVKAKNLLAFRAREPLKVLADEGVSFELELGAVPRPAPEFRSELRQQIAGGESLSKRELRVAAWLRDNKAVILDAADRFHIDRRAIGAVIAWEALENIMRGSPHSVGPGKMHTYSRDWAAVLPLLPKGEALPQQVEAAGFVPRPSSEQDRETFMRSPAGAAIYIAAVMRGASDIASRYGYSIEHDLTALTSFYQGYDLPGWEQHLKEKQAKKETTFVAADPIAVWTQSHIAYLENVLGK
jgi:outer membrane protein OmpA-like peptidoglycan-associated protein